MIKKANLLGKIDELLTLDKGIMPLLNRHISSSIFFSVFRSTWTFWSQRSKAS